MRLICKSTNGLNEFDADSLLANNRIIYLEGKINYQKAMKFAKQIAYLNFQDSDNPAKIFINSPGGEYESGMMIYDIMQNSPVKLQIYCIGMAYSMGAILFSTAKNGRYILPNSKVMIHEPLTGGFYGNTSYIKDVALDMLKVNEKINKMIAKSAGQSIEAINKATKESRIFTAEEAVSFGLADKIMTYSEMLEA